MSLKAFMENETARLRKLIDESGSVVFFGGAGSSTESGIPDFRSAGGIYSRSARYSPEEMLSFSFFREHTEEFFAFYKEHMIYRDAKPHKGHYALAGLEKAGKLKAVVTQNIDGLHQMAGSRNVIELHGSVHRNYCTACGSFHSLGVILESGIPVCECGGLIKPDVVLYEEALNGDTITSAARHISRADLLIVGGTSLSVYPAAGLIDHYRGNRLVLINKSETSFDGRACLLIRGSLGEVLGAL